MTYNSWQFLSGMIEGTSHTTAALRIPFFSLRKVQLRLRKQTRGLKNPMFKSCRGVGSLSRCWSAVSREGRILEPLIIWAFVIIPLLYVSFSSTMILSIFPSYSVSLSQSPSLPLSLSISLFFFFSLSLCLSVSFTVCVGVCFFSLSLSLSFSLCLS